jgi:hypothetical protein
MTTYFVNQYGGYTFPSGEITTVQASPEYKERVSTPAGKGGRYSAGSLFVCLHLQVEGNVVGSDTTDPATTRSAWDNIAALFAPGLAKQLFIDSDRYCNAEPTSFAEAKAWNAQTARYYSATLTANDDPPWFSTTTTSQTLATSGATTFSALGTGPADPVITLVVSAAPAGSLITITDASGNECAISPDSTGTFILDSYADTILKSGVDKYALLTGELLRLLAGSNTLTISLSGGATLSAASLTYQARYY